MFGLFAPQYVKDARDLLKNAHKLLCYRRDIWSEATVAEFEALMEKLKLAIKERNQGLIEQEGLRLDEMAAKHSPPPKDAAIRENCEVLLVAIIIALAVRSYFLQPFAIPTGSMQPTLNGIIGYKTTTEPPNILARVADGVLHGRTYYNVLCKEDGQIVVN
ncbi:MAG TPA: S26 family signal peptidase, partial [Chthoniobacteraceae bacterium]|nr:S26 family signal peptidase [Chthoniobacteraceae bacterium]